MSIKNEIFNEYCGVMNFIMVHSCINKENLEHCIIFIERLHCAPPYITINTRKGILKIMRFFKILYRNGYITQEDLIAQYIEITNNYYTWKLQPSLEIKNKIREFLPKFINRCKEIVELL